MKVIVTGGSGFVGRNLIGYLTSNDMLLNTLNRSALLNINTGIVSDSSVIVHLAGKAHDLKRTSSAEEYYEVNYELTKNIYDIFLKSDAKKFIFVSSVKAVSDSVKGVLKEETVPNPQTHYGKSKLMAEEYIQSQPLPVDKSYYILRPCMIHGPGNRGNLNLLYKFVQKGIPYPLAAFHNKRSFLSVKNLCFVILNLIQKNVSSGIYNVSDDEALSTNEVVSILARSLNRNPKLWAISSNLIRFAARIGDYIKLPLNTERLDKLTENYLVSNTKIKRALEVDLPLTAKDGLAITAVSFKNS